jgi:hypothetical protein
MPFWQAKYDYFAQQLALQALLGRDLEPGA